jgi:hypothetical protein
MVWVNLLKVLKKDSKEMVDKPTNFNTIETKSPFSDIILKCQRILVYIYVQFVSYKLLTLYCLYAPWSNSSSYLVDFTFH